MNANDLIFLVGQKEIELHALRAANAELRAKIEELTAKGPAKRKRPVKK